MRRDYWDDPKAPKPTSRKPSASVIVRDAEAKLLLLRRSDNNLWTIPTGAIKFGETAAQAAVRECEEETGLVVHITRLVGVFTDPRHVIRYKKEVRQPVNICFYGHVIGGKLTTTKEALEVSWVNPRELDQYDIHPAIMLRIRHGLSSEEPYF
jgi:ADP-ribose pyrophosphatase YjhB (NUDIX family)